MFSALTLLPFPNLQEEITFEQAKLNPNLRQKYLERVITNNFPNFYDFVSDSSIGMRHLSKNQNHLDFKFLEARCAKEYTAAINHQFLCFLQYLMTTLCLSQE